MNLRVIEHPLAAALLTRLRNKDTAAEAFRQQLDSLSLMLVLEALTDATWVNEQVETPVGWVQGSRLESMPAIVPVLRAGLGMLDAALRLLPAAPVGFIGMRRIEASGHADNAGQAGHTVAGASSPQSAVGHECYLESLPAALRDRPVLVLDPMLATGGSAVAAAQVLDKAGPGPVTLVCVLAAPEGIAAVQADAPHVRVVTAAVDSHLDERAFIVPGLGDAGDRLYGVA